MESELRQLILGDAWLMDVLRAARTVAPPEWAIGSGVIRNLVWDHLHGFAQRTAARDVDVAYLDTRELSKDAELAWQDRLQALRPDVPWEVKNQAAVHLWYERRFGARAEPLDSIDDAVATWPETATAVAVRLLPDDGLQVIAPLGLADLFDMILRRNPRRVSVEEYQRRYISKAVSQRWPRVKIVDD
jgi:uncharacterized protein